MLSTSKKMSSLIPRLASQFGRRRLESSFSVVKNSDHFVLKKNKEDREIAVTFNWLRDHCRLTPFKAIMTLLVLS